MQTQTLNQQLRDLETQISLMKEAIRSKKTTISLTDSILMELEKEPLTIVELANRLNTTKAITNLAVRKLANDRLIIMSSEQGRRVARFRCFLAAWFPQNWMSYYQQKKKSAAS
jgi:acyl CoA:acetate/3-ketoacid CoA transferase